MPILLAMSEMARDLFFAEKELSGDLQWYDGDKNSLSLVCPLDIAGVTVEGLRLRVTAVRILPDEDVCFQLEHLTERRKYEPLWRLEWKPIRPHTNKGVGPVELRWKSIRQTHIHPFEENYAQEMRSSRGPKLPIAIPIYPHPPIFQDALELAGKELNINNMLRIPRPPWQARMI